MFKLLKLVKGVQMPKKEDKIDEKEDEKDYEEDYEEESGDKGAKDDDEDYGDGDW